MKFTSPNSPGEVPHISILSTCSIFPAFTCWQLTHQDTTSETRVAVTVIALKQDGQLVATESNHLERARHCLLSPRLRFRKSQSLVPQGWARAMWPEGQGRGTSSTTKRVSESSARRGEGWATRPPPAEPPSTPKEVTSGPASSSLATHRKRVSICSPAVDSRTTRSPFPGGSSPTQEEARVRRPSPASAQSPGAVEGGGLRLTLRGVSCAAREAKQPRAPSLTHSADRTSSAKREERGGLRTSPSTRKDEEVNLGRISSNTKTEPSRTICLQAAPSSRPASTTEEGRGVHRAPSTMTQTVQLPAIPPKGEALCRPPTGGTCRLEEVNQTVSFLTWGPLTCHGGGDSATPKLLAARTNLAANDRQERRVPNRAFTTLNPLILGTGVVGQGPRAKAEALQVQLPRIACSLESSRAVPLVGSPEAADHPDGENSEREDGKVDRAAVKTSTSSQVSVSAHTVHGRPMRQTTALAKLAADKAKQRREDLVKAEKACDITIIGVSRTDIKTETGKAHDLPQLELVQHLQQRSEDLATAQDVHDPRVGQVHPNDILGATGKVQHLPQLAFPRRQTPDTCHPSRVVICNKLRTSTDEHSCAGNSLSNSPPPSPDSAIECISLQPEKLLKHEPVFRATAVMALRKSGQLKRKTQMHSVDKDTLFVRGKNKPKEGCINEIIEEESQENCDEEEERELKEKVSSPINPQQSVDYEYEHQPLIARKVQLQKPRLPLHEKLSSQLQITQAKRSIELAKTAREWKAHSQFIRQKSFLERQIPKLDVVKTGNSKARELAMQIQPSEDRTNEAHIDLCLSTKMEDQHLRDQLDKLTKQYEKLEITKREFLRRKEYLQKKWNLQILFSEIPR
ncbi:PREDICTED: uncharacterized protein LOC105988485 [Dipodomys ordii]|uniref:Uncharacterized protein LOC105988485 n=1 Tax=Dipodomys ordii TaxID=10020 RepID=A0A1S3FHP1_DIPOR|nr:PREDICTED: uncharacterized protein LOC105988485 [Dipodomys ordii]